MRFLLMAVLVLSGYVVSYAQHVVSGKVMDISNNEPLTSASVMLNGKGVATAADGSFQLNNVPEGKYLLKVTYIGYYDFQKSIDVSGDVKEIVLLKPETRFTDEVIVSATRADEKTPTTYTTVDKEEIQSNNLGQDLPYLLNWTPSLVTTSDAGAGVGYTGLRIRGSDATRINVTINGVPLNDSESQNVFWVDIPDIASSTQNIQIQRGVGTSTNGAGAFGGSINLQTNTLAAQPYADVVNSYGSYNTWRHTVGFGTGRFNKHWSVDGRFSKISSDGYIDRASSDLSSYYLSGGYYSDKTIVKAIVFGGKEVTYQSWYGTPEAVLNNDQEGIEEVIANNGLDSLQAVNMKNSGRTFNWYTYDNQVDDYKQDHYQLHISQKLGNQLVANASLHYTKGKGYYEQYQRDDDFEDYNLDNVIVGNDTITSTDLIRRRWLDNDFYGITYSFEYSEGPLSLVHGGAVNNYDGGHYGEIIWAKYASNSFINDRYYDNDGEKLDWNEYLKITYQVNRKLSVYGDVQMRLVNYDINGVDSDLRDLNISKDYTFLNPKAGGVYQLDNNSSVYASYSVANREPVRTDFVDSPVVPKHETLHDLEAGYRVQNNKYAFSANGYFMDYKNQLVLTGAVNDVGSSLRTNVKDSYRLGIELVGGVKLSDYVDWKLNATFSQNKIKDFEEVIYDYGADFDEYNVVENEYQDTDIAFSPNVIAGSQLTFLPFVQSDAFTKGITFTILSKYVGKQYLDNTENDSRSIDSYFVNDARVNFSWKPGFVKELNFTFQANNLFNEKYSSNGYTFGYQGGAYVVRENYYYPQATRNYMLSLSIKL